MGKDLRWFYGLAALVFDDMGMFYRNIISIADDKISVNLPFLAEHSGIEILAQKDDLLSFRILEDLDLIRVIEIDHQPITGSLKSRMDQYTMDRHYFIKFETTEKFDSFHTFTRL